MLPSTKEERTAYRVHRVHIGDNLPTGCCISRPSDLAFPHRDVLFSHDVDHYRSIDIIVSKAHEKRQGHAQNAEPVQSKGLPNEG